MDLGQDDIKNAGHNVEQIHIFPSGSGVAISKTLLYHCYLSYFTLANRKIGSKYTFNHHLSWSCNKTWNKSYSVRMTNLKLL